ncbi:hypothetical protein PUN28_005635 [Cardiocondyla obscurior]|uniref:Secreted protein n=1 Tax=Cardiocondyla obscurior TaxID=286306 RepID=A0AAW2GMS0_9HYME
MQLNDVVLAGLIMLNFTLNVQVSISECSIETQKPDRSIIGIADRRPFDCVATRRALGTMSGEKERDRAELFAAERGPTPPGRS